MNIGIQGIKGTFHIEAAIQHFGQGISIFPYLTFPKLVESVLSGESTAGLKAAENTISGTIHSNLGIIAFYEVDLNKIESVPIIGEHWHYRFYVDLLFDSTDQFRNALSVIKPLVDELSILGKYLSGIDSLNQIHQQS